MIKQRKKSITIKDLADKANVSIASVSRVINNDPSVRPDIRQAVEQAIKELNYEPKTRNRNGITNRIGLLIPDITNPYFSLLIKAIASVARIQGKAVVLLNANMHRDTESEHIQSLQQIGLDGLIHIPFSETPDPALVELVESRFPIVFLDREINIDNICAVTSNNEEGAYQATTYLLNLGHRDIAFISGLPHLSTSVTRFAGFKRGMAEFGLEPNPDLILQGDTSLKSGLRETKRLLESKHHFTAIFASNDSMAFGAWRALEDAGCSIPQDVSIIGYDDIPFASFISLTTIAQPGYEIGRNAMQLLMDLIEGRREPPQRIVLRDSLIIRKSCQKI
ncbi:MAG TPA: LacI family DNA-binding transcriptional regulator [Anaerolineales bacterium]|nr:LacI family DNA-binding transcriptional regulator [Anaerolineales bacterium]